MRTRTLLLLATLVVSGITLQAASPVPRPSKEFSMILPSGKQTLLSSYRGKVVMLAGMFTTCPHCQALSKIVTKLQDELGPRGFQALGVAFNDEVNTPNAAANAQVTAAFVRDYGVGFPVGSVPRNNMMSYLGLSEIESWSVPQVVIIDRKGVIRAQSEGRGTANLQTESYLRKYLGDLLDEGGAKAAPAKSPAKKTTPKKTT